MRRSRLTLPADQRSHRLDFEAIGTHWQIDTVDPVEDTLRAAIADRVERYDRTWSRFRSDSLVSQIGERAGQWILPDEAGELFELYRGLYLATGGAMSPLVGRSLDAIGYDRGYSLRPSGSPVAAPTWDEAVAWDGEALTTLRPVSLDIGAAGKGHLVDLVGAVLGDSGHSQFVIDASGDIRHWGADLLRVGLEDPRDTTKAIGIARISNAAICSSATNRRQWGTGLHHVVDALTGLPTSTIVATWAIAPTALAADGLATALFFTDPARLSELFDFRWVRLDATGRVEFSPDFDGELFT
ncbi:MAG: FAD:protein FMN transferase [Salinibacterium sp.]|nr:FAD:protein FMN transferase [Salinibacterium sp.]